MYQVAEIDVAEGGGDVSSSGDRRGTGGGGM